MSHAQQDPAAASAPVLSKTANGDAIRSRVEGPFDAHAQNTPREIEIIAKRFAFEPSRVDVTEGERVRLVVSSDDGVHGVEIKKFRVNKKVPRGGERVTMDFVASAPGEYPILCSEYCGKGHEEMQGTLVVVAKGLPR